MDAEGLMNAEAWWNKHRSNFSLDDHVWVMKCWEDATAAAEESRTVRPRLSDQALADAFLKGNSKNGMLGGLWAVTDLVSKNLAGKSYAGAKDHEEADAAEAGQAGADSRQEGGGHYMAIPRGLQPWNVVSEWGLGFFDGNALKYLARWRTKGGVEDLKKARHYLDKLIELVEEGGKP